MNRDNDLDTELLERCQILVDLDGSQIDAWVSGMFGLWDTPEDARSFIEACAADGGPAATLVLRAVGELADPPLADWARAVAAPPTEVPAAAAEIGAARFWSAWEVSAPFGATIVLAAGVDGDAPDHAVLVAIEDAAVTDLHLSGDPADWLPESDPDDPLPVDINELALGAALERVGAAWTKAAALDVPRPPSLVANQHVVRLRLARSGVAPLPLVPTSASVDVAAQRGMTAAELADADRAARSTLVSALRLETDAARPVDGAWVEVVTATVPYTNHHEAAALSFLEWADWLGVGIELARAGAGAAASGPAFVDLVNRCPEVSSTIGRDDRDYVEWAFDLAIEHLADAGLVAAGTLTDDGHATLVGSLLAAWSSPRSETDESSGD